MNQPWHQNCAGKTTVQFCTSIEPTDRWMGKVSIDKIHTEVMIVMENLLYAHKYILEIMMNVAKQAYWRLIFDTVSPEVNTSIKCKGRRNLLYANQPIMYLLEVSAYEN